jgi:hypothetical protein
MPFEDDLGWEYFGGDPMNSPRMMEHMDWHADPDNQARTGNYGDRFLVFHRQYVDQFDAYRQSRNLLPVTPWDPATPIPPDLAHPRTLSAPRTTDNPMSVNPACRTPTWATLAGGSDADPLHGYTSLLQFQSLDELGRSIDAGWHGTVHNTIGGDMAAYHSPIDPVFWRWHRWIDTVRAAWEANHAARAALRLGQTVRLLFGDAARPVAALAATAASAGAPLAGHPDLARALVAHLIEDATTFLGPPQAAAAAGQPTAQGPPRRALAAAALVRPQAAANLANTYVVYVHGICKHVAGFSDDWWAALRTYLPELPEPNRREVVWSDVIEPGAPEAEVVRAERRTAEALALIRPRPVSGPASLAAHIKDILADRAARQYVAANVQTTTPGAAGVVAVPPSLAVAAPQALFNIPGLECIDDFMAYLLQSDTRSQVIDRFNGVVQPLLQQAGVTVHVISHSWGTVVAYEALRGLDGASQFADGSVATLFTVGSALSIAPVKRMLLPNAIDGARPRLVRTWVNLNAHFDIVGGHLQGNPFEVDDEYLELPAVGCSTWIPNPVCAHSSYFNSANDTVNRDIFAHYIQA